MAQSDAPRVFARGVVTTIPPDLQPENTTSVHDMVEIRANESLRWQPKTLPATRTLYNRAENVRFSREVWGLEFAFKPLRMIRVDVPQPDGSLQRKLYWYLVYRITNNGDRLKPNLSDTGEFTAEPAEPQPVTFLPHFVLQGQDVDASGQKIYKAYLDRLVPPVMETIRRREIPHRVLLDSVEMAETPIPVSSPDEDRSVWGVAIWEDVDPEIDFLSIFVSGLTNAHIWSDQPGAFQPGDPIGKGRSIVSKTLQLNFWRPGDEFLESETEIRFGVPSGRADLYGVAEGVAYEWVFR